jgi:hypothetical protein
MLAEAMSDASILGQGELPAEDLGMTSSGELPPHQMQMSPERSPMRSSSSLLIEKQAEVVAAPSGPICEGFLYKRKSPAKSGKRVWAVLKVDSLYIYKHQGVPSSELYGLDVVAFGHSAHRSLPHECAGCDTARIR